MNPLGIRLPRLPVALVRERVLEAVGRPLLSLLRSEEGEPYLDSWVDRDETLEVDRWLIFRISERDLVAFLYGRSTLLELLRGARSGVVYVADMRGAELISVAITTFDDLPLELLPTAESFYDPELDPNGRPNEQAFLIERVIHHIGPVADLERKFVQVYSFLSAVQPDFVPQIPSSNGDVAVKRRVEEYELVDPKLLRVAEPGLPYGGVLDGRFSGYRFGGGWIHHVLFDELESVIPSEQRAQFLAVSIQSPGVLRLRAEPEGAARVHVALQELSRHREAASRAYRDLHRAVLDLRDVDGVDGVELDAAFIPHIRRMLAILTGVSMTDLLTAAGSAQAAAEVLASYYRRLDALLRHVESGFAVVMGLEIEAEKSDSR